MSGLILRILRAPGPTTSLQEILYGFIMALIFVYAARFGLTTYADPADFIIIVTGMNLTWGAIDGAVFYYLDVCDQRKYARLIADASIDRDARLEALIDEFGSTPLDVLSDADKRAACEQMLDRDLQPEEGFIRDRRSMLLSSVGCFVWTALTVIPVAVPVILIGDFDLALRAAQLLSSALLFMIGFLLGPHLGLNRWMTGAVLTVISLTISVIATFTGG